MSPVSSKWIGFVKLSIFFDVWRNKNPDWEIVWTYNIKPLCRLKYWAHLEICKIHMKSNGHRQKKKIASQVIKQKPEWREEREGTSVGFPGFWTVLCSQKCYHRVISILCIDLIFLWSVAISAGIHFSSICVPHWVSWWHIDPAINSSLFKTESWNCTQLST